MCMKKMYSFFLSAIVMGLLLVSPATAQNLLLGGDMESVDSWTLASFNSVGDVVTNWGYTADRPASGAGAALYVKTTHVTGAPNAQFAFYQAVTLEAGKTYALDAAIKVIGQVKTSWFEFYVGSPDPAGMADYSVTNGTANGVVENGITKLASYYSWWTALTTPANPNSTLQIGANGTKATFTPTETRTYYFLVKLGSNAAGTQEILLDNVMFGENITFLATKPKVTFEANRRVGFAPFTLDLISTATNPETYEWTVSDGKTANTATATMTFDQAGKYDVKLKVSNAIGYDTLLQKDFIQVMTPVEVRAGGVVTGGAMESADKSSWQVSTLANPTDLDEAGQLSSLAVTWGYTGANTPTAGDAGALRVQINANGGDIVQYCIYKKVNLESNIIYRFNAAYHDLSNNLWRNWTEVFIGKAAPEDGNDFGTANGTQLASLGNWETRTGIARGLDGTFQLNATNNAGFSTNEPGEYYFVIKVGVQGAGAGLGANNCDILLDEISLVGEHPKPYTDFSAENESGFSPLTVQFKNLTQYGTGYEWNFGDGSAVSTASDPTHTYNAIGDYTVTLKASNINGDSTLVKTAFVSVVEAYDLPDGEKLYGGNMEKGGFWKTTPYGINLKAPSTWNYTAESFTGSEGGVLRVQTGRVAFYQPVRVRAGYIYKFDCDVHVKSSSTNMWIQTFMWETEPPQDSDPLLAANTMAELRTYADASVSGYQGKFSAKSIKGASYPDDKGTYKATYDATMWFAIKLGTNSTMDVLLDNLTLKESKAPVEPDFSSDITGGNAPLTVQFYDLTTGNPTSRTWDFGDGTTITGSSDAELMPYHTYEQGGVYTVTLTITDENDNSASKTYENYITVIGTGLNTLPAGCSIYVADGSICIDSKLSLSEVKIYDVRGILLESEKMNGLAFKSKQLATGLYILDVDGHPLKVLVK